MRPAWQSACLRFHENPAPTATASAAQVRQPIYRESVDLWRNYRQELAPLARQLAHNGVRSIDHGLWLALCLAAAGDRSLPLPPPNNPIIHTLRSRRRGSR